MLSPLASSRAVFSPPFCDGYGTITCGSRFEIERASVLAMKYVPMATMEGVIMAFQRLKILKNVLTLFLKSCI